MCGCGTWCAIRLVIAKRGAYGAGGNQDDRACDAMRMELKGYTSRSYAPVTAYPDEMREGEIVFRGERRAGKKCRVVRACIDPEDYEYIINLMVELNPTIACDAFNKALKKQLRKSKIK